MSELINRIFKKFTWQYIDWKKISKYIDSLKSSEYIRIPLSTFSSSNLNNSSLLILFALKPNWKNLIMEISLFEFGYILFCFSNCIDFDVGFFYYYRNIRSNSHLSNLKMNLLIKKTHYSLAIFFLQEYGLYLKNVCSKLNIEIYSIKNLLKNKLPFQVDQSYNYLLIRFKNLIDYSIFKLLLTKVPLHKGLIKFVSLFFKVDRFQNLTRSFDIGIVYSLFYSNSLIEVVLEIIFLQIIYEVGILMNYLLKFQDNSNEIFFFYYYKFLLILYKPNYKIAPLETKSRSLFRSYLIILQTDLVKNSGYLRDGLSTELFFISTRYKVYPFYFLIKPSLYHQFILMRQISSVLSEFRSRHIFILKIRLNMLIFLWSFNYINIPVKKIFYLLDYLISLKLRILPYQKKSCYAINHFSIKEQKKIKLKVSLIRKKMNLLPIICIYNDHHYKFFYLLKLIWLLKGIVR